MSEAGSTNSAPPAEDPIASLFGSEENSGQLDGEDLFGQTQQQHEPDQQASEQEAVDDLTARWQAALAGDDDSEGFLPSDDEGFLPDSDDETPVQNSASRPDGTLGGFASVSAGSIPRVPSAASRYTPQPQIPVQPPARLQHAGTWPAQQPQQTPYHPYAPPQQAFQAPVSHIPGPAPTAPYSAFGNRPPPASAEETQSFVDKKEGYQSPYDLPLDMNPLAIRKRPSNLQQSQSAMPVGVGSMASQPPPVRVSSMGAVFSTGAPIQAQQPQGPPKPKAVPQHKFFEELPLAPPRQRAASAFGRHPKPMNQVPSGAGSDQMVPPRPGSVGAWNNHPAHFHPGFLGGVEDLPTKDSSSGSSKWIPGLSSDVVSNSLWGTFNKFVAGEEEETSSTAGGEGSVVDAVAGPFPKMAGSRNVSPEISMVQSGADLYSAYNNTPSYTPTPPVTAEPTSQAPNRYAPSNPYQPKSSLYQPATNQRATSGTYQPAGYGGGYRPGSSPHASRQQAVNPYDSPIPSSVSTGYPGTSTYDSGGSSGDAASLITKPETMGSSGSEPHPPGGGYEPPSTGAPLSMGPGTGEWIPKLSSDAVSDSLWGTFNKFVAGEEGEAPSTAGGEGNVVGAVAGPFPRVAGSGNVSPEISIVQSGADLYSSYNNTPNYTSGPPATIKPASQAANRYAPSNSYQPKSSLYEPAVNQRATSGTYQPAGYGGGYRPSSSPHAPRQQAVNPYDTPVPSSVSTDYPGISTYDSRSSSEDTASSITRPETMESSATESHPPSGGYQPPSGGGYEPPSAEFTPYEPNNSDDENEDNKPKAKKPFMDDDDEFTKGAAERARKLQEEEVKKADEEKKNAAQGEGKKGWFSGWFARKDPSQPGPIKAKLGEESSFVYDPDLKRWVNKKAGDTAVTAPKPAPPPKRASTPALQPSSTPLALRFPSTGTSSAPPASRAHALPPPPGRSPTPPSIPATSTPPPPPGRSLTPSSIPLPATPPPPPGPTTPVPPSTGSPTAGLPSRPPTSMSQRATTGDAIDDLLSPLGAPVSRKSTPGGGKKRRKSRYVEVIPGQS